MEVSMEKTVISGALLASAVALMFLATPSFAGSSPSTSQPAQVKCVGGNSCKGLSACKTATSAGPGKNSCKGQGMIYTKTAQECIQKGGKVMKM
jgi:hypothetical protein